VASGPAEIQQEMTALPVGKGAAPQRQGQGGDSGFGSMVTPALAAAEALDASVADMRFVKPLDTADPPAGRTT
jgi:1-deoxy-D-xylulose-5-phosphate synthase